MMIHPEKQKQPLFIPPSVFLYGNGGKSDVCRKIAVQQHCKSFFNGTDETISSRESMSRESRTGLHVSLSSATRHSGPYSMSHTLKFSKRFRSSRFIQRIIKHLTANTNIGRSCFFDVHLWACPWEYAKKPFLNSQSGMTTPDKRIVPWDSYLRNIFCLFLTV